MDTALPLDNRVINIFMQHLAGSGKCGLTLTDIIECTKKQRLTHKLITTSDYDSNSINVSMDKMGGEISAIMKIVTQWNSDWEPTTTLDIIVLMIKLKSGMPSRHVDKIRSHLVSLPLSSSLPKEEDHYLIHSLIVLTGWNGTIFDDVLTLQIPQYSLSIRKSFYKVLYPNAVIL